jgi:hypothetical protein
MITTTPPGLVMQSDLPREVTQSEETSGRDGFANMNVVCSHCNRGI